MNIQIISHRGYWKTVEEKNLKVAFDRSFTLGFGTETDIRDLMGELVIAHDMPGASAMQVESFFEIYNNYSAPLPLALNIKADGLQTELKQQLIKYSISNYFVFDMSIPDTIGYIKQGITFFSRQSEYEPQPAFYNECGGVWLDAFNSIWYNNQLISDHLSNNKQVAIISPELHKRDHLSLWQQLKDGNLHRQSDVILCTDIPEDAVKFFKDQI